MNCLVFRGFYCSLGILPVDWWWWWSSWSWSCSNSARFLWKSIPSAVKENQPEVVAVWRIGQKLWTRDYAGVHEAIRSFDWSQETRALVAAFSGEFSITLITQLLECSYSLSCLITNEYYFFLNVMNDSEIINVHI